MEQNVNIIQDAYGAFSRGDIAAVLATLDENVVWSIPGPSEIPLFGTRQGRAAVGEFFQTLDRDQETLLFEPRRYVAQGNTVVALVPSLSE